MHEGVKDNPPWVELVELDLEARRYALAERFAAGIEAEIEWIEGSEEELFAALEVHELDLVVGGITSVSPWASVAALTHPYLTTASLVAVPEGREPPDDIAAFEVGVESSSELEGLLRKTDARVIEVEDVAAHEGAVAIDNYLLDDLDVVDTGALPFGYHRAVNVGYLCASLALFVMGLFILDDSVMKFISFEHAHAPIGLVQPWGEPIWLGWFMIPALVYSAIPAVIIGWLKLPLARELHDKVLYADAQMNKPTGSPRSRR